MTTVAQTPQTPPTSSGNQLNSSFVQSKMQIPPNLQVPYQKIIAAGRAIMYSQQMSPQIVALMKGPDPVGQKLGQGAVALIALMVAKSNHTMPPQLIIPCATELLTEFADFLTKAGVQVTDQDIANGMAVMVGQIMQRCGISPQQLQAMMASKGKQAAGGAQPPAAPGAPPAAPPAAPPSGMLAGAMTPPAAAPGA